MDKDQSLHAAVMKWYVQQRSIGVNIRGVEIMAAAKLALLISKVAMVGFSNFKMARGYLIKYCMTKLVLLMKRV